MIARKFFLVFSLFFVFLGTNDVNAQVSGYAIVLNEYNVSNVLGTGQADDKGIFNDYVEIYNNYGQSISLSGYWLSNDRNNLFKWKFPGNFQMAKDEYKVVWLSGRNTNDGVNFHANFTIEQCKNQWLILSSPSGVPYDSVKILPTKPGDVRGRNTDYITGGVGSWQIYPTKTPKAFNGAPIAKGYAPTPQFMTSTPLATVTPTVGGVNAGGFSVDLPTIYIKLSGVTYDSLFSCYDIFYTKNGDYPVPFYNGSTTNGTYFRYVDSVKSLITLDKTTILRAIAVIKKPYSNCPQNILPSFCETNTYFVGTEHNEFDKDFGVISIAMETTQRLDTNWFNSQGVPSTSIHVEYYDGQKQLSEGYAMIQRPIQEEWRTKQKGFYIAKDDRLGSGCNFEGPVFNVKGLGTSSRTVFPQLHLHGGDIESHSTDAGALSGQAETQGTGMRDIFMHSLAAKHNLKVNPLHIKPVVAFVNGRYWGVYDLREIYDKHYEQFYNGQSPDSLDLNFVHGGPSGEGRVTYWDVPGSSMGASFNTEVYDIVNKNSMTEPPGTQYKKVMSALDKDNFIDFLILNSYGMNSDLWTHNLAVAKGANKNKPGGKWHFYLWNVPTLFNFTSISTSNRAIADVNTPICYLQNYTNYALSTTNLNAQGLIFNKLMNGTLGNPTFQREYKNRYMDLLNGPLSCDSILSHFDYLYNLFAKEMKYHASPASAPQPGKFTITKLDLWDTLMLGSKGFRTTLEKRCFIAANNFPACYGSVGPFDLMVDVTPKEAGKVQVNSIIPETYPWYSKYYATLLTLQAIPTNTDYVFHHWEFSNMNLPANQSFNSDSVSLNFNISSTALAVFTDKRNAISNSGGAVNIPSGFTPNDDGLNDIFKPLVSPQNEYVREYQMTIWNRWGQEVFRSTSLTDGWDGRYKSQLAQTGVYAYLVTYKDISNKDQVVKGNITLTR